MVWWEQIHQYLRTKLSICIIFSHTSYWATHHIGPHIKQAMHHIEQCIFCNAQIFVLKIIWLNFLCLKLCDINLFEYQFEYNWILDIFELFETYRRTKLKKSSLHLIPQLTSNITLSTRNKNRFKHWLLIKVNYSRDLLPTLLKLFFYIFLNF